MGSLGASPWTRTVPEIEARSRSSFAASTCGSATESTFAWSSAERWPAATGERKVSGAVGGSSRGPSLPIALGGVGSLFRSKSPAISAARATATPTIEWMRTRSLPPGITSLAQLDALARACRDLDARRLVERHEQRLSAIGFRRLPRGVPELVFAWQDRLEDCGAGCSREHHELESRFLQRNQPQREALARDRRRWRARHLQAAEHWHAQLELRLARAQARAELLPGQGQADLELTDRDVH